MTQAADAVTEQARQHLAAALGCAPDQINVLRAEAVTWRDSALGCPQPDMMYMQVLTPGYRIILEQAGRHYTYHTDNGQRVVRCDRGSQAPLDSHV